MVKDSCFEIHNIYLKTVEYSEGNETQSSAKI